MEDWQESGHQREGRGGKRRGPRLAAGLLILVLVIVGFALIQAGDEDGPLNEIAAAAEKTREEPGGRMVLRARITSPTQAEPIVMTGRGAFDTSGRSRVTMTMPVPGAEGSAEFEVVGEIPKFYIRSSLFEGLPGGKEWMAFDVSFGGELDMPVPADGNPNGELEALEEVSGEVRELGTEDVRGVSTTRYRTEVSVAEQVDRLREEGADDLASFIEERGGPMEVEAWIDGDDLIRRMRMVQTQPPGPGKGSTTMDMRSDLFDLGAEPEIELPDSSEVFDATSIVEDEIDDAGEE